MNHHSFRFLIKEIPADVIKSANINPAHFKAVCYTLSLYGDYETGTSIRPSWLTVAREAGVNRKTAMKVRDYLIDMGIIIKIKVNEANISEYKFADVDQLSLFEDQMSNNDEQLSKTKDQLSNIDGHNTTYNSNLYTTKNINDFFEGIDQEEVSPW